MSPKHESVWRKLRRTKANYRTRALEALLAQPLQSSLSGIVPAARYIDSGAALELVSDAHWAVFFDEHQFAQSATISHISTGLQR